MLICVRSDTAPHHVNVSRNEYGFEILFSEVNASQQRASVMEW
ncbi:unnamed protein product [Amoebophrya sp. A25]|nr:unnamed protein product [Amoebophrya sp. A25]|eukprot:GSA25T00012501001.1